MKRTLWTRDFTRITAATALGAAGGIISQFALSFLVFDETGSTLAAALSVAIQLIPMVLLPLIIAPMMDRLPRKPFLVWGDLLNGVCYAGAGIFLLHNAFSYTAYLAFSLLVSCLGAFDELAYNSFYPLLLPEGQEERAYTVSAMLYPILKVLMMPLAALLYDTLGVGRLLLIQAVLSVLAALIENSIHVQENRRDQEPLLSLKTWWRDVREAADYLRQERGLHGLYTYMAVTNGMAMSYAPLLIAFFRTAQGFTTAMYSFFSVAEFTGRTIGGVVRYRFSLPERKRFGFLFGVYQTYELMDACLLWLPYPLMLVNRALCGFLGIQSATIRQAAVQRYIPDRLRARLNAYESLLCTAAGAVLSLAIGALGEVLDYRLCRGRLWTQDSCATLRCARSLRQICRSCRMICCLRFYQAPRLCRQTTALPLTTRVSFPPTSCSGSFSGGQTAARWRNTGIRTTDGSTFRAAPFTGRSTAISEDTPLISRSARVMTRKAVQLSIRRRLSNLGIYGCRESQRRWTDTK